jgi:hypothetical protein
VRSTVRFLIALFLTLPASAASLHEEIDRLIAAKATGPVAARADDAEFCRRVYLDLTGSIPAADRAKSFIDDASPGKRAALIDRLLASPEYPRRMQEAFTLMLMERRTTDAEWDKFLRESFAENKPLDQLSREILGPNPDDARTRAAAEFYTKRLENIGQVPVDYPRLARDVGRLFFGEDLACAQCHNHKYVKDYKQGDFQGIFAFVGTTYIRRDVKFPAVGEKVVDKKLEYMSVFNKDKKETGPRVPGGTEVAVPAFKKGEEWAVPPDKKANFPGVPKFSPLKALAAEAPRSPLFAKNLANRLWFLMMGRGLIHPLDMDHGGNPPSHPELMTLLADQLKAMKYDPKAFLRELALSETYQRSSVLPSAGARPPGPETFLVANSKRISAEQFTWSVLTATGELDRISNGVPVPKPAKAAEPAADDGNERPVAKAPAKPATLAEVRKKFVTAFASPVGEAEVEPVASLAGALFVSNSDMLLDWLKPRPGNLIDRLEKLNDADAIADELYLSVLTRRPDAGERKDVAAYLSKNEKRRTEALGELAWSLLASTEFFVNH